jgi:hypothetical protein
MKTRTAILATLLATVFPAHAQDTLVLKSGERRTGTILSADDKSFRLEVKLGEPSAPGAPLPKPPPPSPARM